MARKGEKISAEVRAKMRDAALGEKNHRFGKTTTDEHKKKISDGNKGKVGYWKGRKQPKEMVDKRTDYLKGRTVSELTRKKISDANTGKKRSRQQRERNSEIVTNRYLSGWNPMFGYTRGYFFSRKSDKDIYFRSSYELLAYKILEEDSSVLSYCTESEKIPYFWGSIKRYYIPDIKVFRTGGDVEILEIKASWQLRDDRVTEKFYAAEIYCLKKGFKFSVWTEKDILNG